MKSMQELQERYVVDAEGNPVAVLLDIKVYQQLLEALEELEAIQALRRSESVWRAARYRWKRYRKIITEEL